MRHGNTRTVPGDLGRGLPALSERMRTEGHRFVQVLAVNTEEASTCSTSFMKDGVLEVFTIGVKQRTEIPIHHRPSSPRSCSRTRSTTCSA